MNWLGALALVAAGLFACPASGQLKLSVDTTTGAYTIQNGASVWLQSSVYGIRMNSKVLSSGDGSLKLNSTSTAEGDDMIGHFETTSLSWQDETGIVYVTQFRTYADADAITFEQHFPQGLSGAANGDDNDIIAIFPSFNEAQSKSGMLNYLTYAGTFCGGRMGAWGDGSYSGGFQFGPLALYDSSLNTAVFSAMNNFMTGIPSRSKSFGGAVGFGIQARVNAVPNDYVHAVLMQGGQGVKATMAKWGKVLLKLGGKLPSTFQSDASISHLGYYTDNGAYYYYKTEKGKNYQQTMLDVKAEAMKLEIPFNYFQFDSWWYYKDSGSAVTLWEPRPDVFPDGMTDWLGLPLVLHNRWWSPHNNYSADWFIAEKSCALPKSEDIFDYIMTKAKKWGMIVYEQDWLVTTYERMNATQADLHNAENWLRYMGAAASKLNITVQYCMPLPMHMLQSTSIQSVSQARASNDYHPGNTNWNVGLTSLFYWSIGVVPFKDDFFTYKGEETGCPYGTQGCIEPNNELVTLVATLTGGPVGPSDGVEFLNKALIMRTCRADGLLLKPDEPAIFHDASMKLGFEKQERFEIWHTMTNISGGMTHYVLAIDLEQAAPITLADLGAASTDNFVAYEYFSSCPLNMTECNFKADYIQHVNSSHPLNLWATKKADKPVEGLKNGAVTYQYWVISQTWPNGFTPMGEGNKLVPVSRQRTLSISGAVGQPIKATVTGVPNEKVSVYAMLPSGQVASGDIPILASGKGTLTCSGHNYNDLHCVTS